tara:strand:- start:7093 stop:8499 length:1407 start_codon:yes stop_codon:yes gene_type:complete
MVPKIHAKGASFAGIAQYLLHDKDRATTSDRVAWTSTRNLISEDPHHAWKIMAATAMDADRLKANAGIKNTGRKSINSVLHLSLAWHPKEGESLIPEEMQRAANLAIKALGAEDRQVLIVAHNDEEQPHVHIVINRVSSEDGRMLPSSKEKLNLSKFAQTYEEERGEVLCEERVINNAARDRGEYTRGEKDTPRHIYEQQASNDNRQVRHQQREKDRAVGKRQRAIKDQQAKAWAKLQADQKQRGVELREQQKRNIETAKQRVRDEYKDPWRELFHEHQAQTRLFEKNETSFLGRMKNRLRGVDVKSMVGGDQKKQAIGEAFDAFASSGARLEQLKKDQAKAEAVLKAQQRKEEQQAAEEARKQAQINQNQARVKYQTDRADLVLKQSMEQAKMRTEWVTRKQQRESAETREHQSNPPSSNHEIEPSDQQSLQQDERTRKLIESYRQIQSNNDQQSQDKDRDQDEHER